MSKSVGDNSDQRREPEDHVAEVNERNMRDQIGFEGAVKIKEDEQDNDGNDRAPELLLFGCIVGHVRYFG
jgi:hypothetical protein